MRISAILAISVILAIVILALLAALGISAILHVLPVVVISGMLIMLATLATGRFLKSWLCYLGNFGNFGVRLGLTLPWTSETKQHFSVFSERGWSLNPRHRICLSGDLPGALLHCRRNKLVVFWESWFLESCAGYSFFSVPRVRGQRLAFWAFFNLLDSRSVGLANPSAQSEPWFASYSL